MTPTAASVTKYGSPVGAADRDRLIVENLPLVRWAANRLHDSLPPTVLLEDLISTGVVGLISAIDNFDPRYNVQLSTYALPRIRGAMLDSVRGLDGLSANNRRRLKGMELAISTIEQGTGRSASEDEIAGELQLSIDEYHKWVHDLQGVKLASLEPANDEGPSLLSMLAEDESAEPGFQVERFELERVLARGVESLPERERLVLSLYFIEELTLREIAAVMKVHLTRVAQLKTQALVRLRAYMERYWPKGRGGSR